MATYKVLQDIEAEDKLFGPFTLKQFIFAAIAIVIGFIGFRVAITGIPVFIKVPFILMLLPFFAVFGFLAAPIGQDQPNDIWLFARLRFLFKPRLRIWNQDGLSDLVTITAPKRVETVFTKDFTQDEVRSRLQALANTVDSRGWAVKNVNTNLFGQASYVATTTSDRLLDPASLPQEVTSIDVLPSDDMLDTNNNATAQHLDQLVKQSTSEHKQQVRQQVSGQQTAQQPSAQDYWFMNQPAAPKISLPQDYATFSNQPVVTPGTNDVIQSVEETAEEKALAEKLIAEKQQAQAHVSDHMRVLQPLHDKEGKPVPQPQPVVTQKTPEIPVNPAILELANNDDLNVATIARQAQKMNKPKDDGEVVISLH